MKKLLIFVNVDWFFVSHRLPIAIAAINSGYEVHIVTEITDESYRLERYGFIVHPLLVGRGGVSIFNEIKTVLKITSILKKVKPDILHLITIKPVLYGGLAAHLVKVKGIVVAISGLGYVFTNTARLSRLKLSLIKGLYFLALNHSNLKVIFQNIDDRNTLSEFARLSDSQTVLIPGSGVNLDDYPYSSETDGDLIVVMASRLLKDKGVCEFVNASGLVGKRNKRVFFKLAGTVDLGNPASITVEQVDKWRLNPNIEILGHVDDIPKLFSSAHVIVLPSYREGFPKVLIEASACGRAIVTSDVPGCRDAIIPNKTGLLVPPRDAKALSKAIMVLLDDFELRKNMGLEARILAEKRYSIDKVVVAHLNIYKSLQDVK